MIGRELIPPREEPGLGYAETVGGTRYVFADLKALLARATPPRSGDRLAGLEAADMTERVAAQLALADLPLRRLIEDPVLPYETDEITRLIIDSHNRDAFVPIAAMTVGELRNWLLSDAVDAPALAHIVAGLTPEIAAAILDGLMLGSGDAVIGINPATDSLNKYLELTRFLDQLRERLDLPGQSCVLAHVTTALAAIERGAPVDLVFQSVVGTEAANRHFGINLALLREARDATLSLGRGTVGSNVMYFETGQGSALSAEAHHGVDQQTLEARAYAVARAFDPLLVNSIVGFIGPEYLFNGKEIMRAGLEDHFCGKLLGLPMGCDVCYTNHAEADQDDMDALLTLL